MPTYSLPPPHPAVLLRDQSNVIANRIAGMDLLPPSQRIVARLHDTAVTPLEPLAAYEVLCRAQGFANALFRHPLSTSLPAPPNSPAHGDGKLRSAAAEGFFWGALEIQRAGGRKMDPELVEILAAYKPEIVDALMTGRSLTNQVVPLAARMIQRYDEAAATSEQGNDLRRLREPILKRAIARLDCVYLDLAIETVENMPYRIGGYKPHSTELYGDLTPILREILFAAKEDLALRLIGCNDKQQIDELWNRTARNLPRIVSELIAFGKSFVWPGPSSFRFDVERVFPAVIVATAIRAVRSGNLHDHRQVIDAFPGMLTSMEKAATPETALRFEAHLMAVPILTHAVESGDFSYPARAVAALPAMAAAVERASATLRETNTSVPRIYLDAVTLLAFRTGQIDAIETLVNSLPGIHASWQHLLAFISHTALKGDEQAVAALANKRDHLILSAFLSGTTNLSLALAHHPAFLRSFARRTEDS